MCLARSNTWTARYVVPEIGVKYTLLRTLCHYNIRYFLHASDYVPDDDISIGLLHNEVTQEEYQIHLMVME